MGEDFAHYEIAAFDERTIAEFVKRSTRANDPTGAVSRSFLAELSRSEELRALARNPLFLTIMLTLFISKAVLPSEVEFLEESLDLLLSKLDVAKGTKTTNLRLPETKSLLATLAFSAQNADLALLDESFVLSVFSGELVAHGLSPSEARSQSISLLETFNERSGILIRVATGIFRFFHKAFREYLASIALTESDNYIDQVKKHCNSEVWWESILLSIARIARTRSRAAEDVIRALTDSQSAGGVLLAGRALLNIAPIKNTDLREQVVKSLEVLVANPEVADSLRSQANAILEKLGQAQ